MSEVTVWGIDLGTTYSAIARLDSLGRPEVIQNREGQYTTPSVVLFETGGEGAVVGQEAKNEAVLDPDRVVEFVKRFMGQPGWSKDVDGREYRPEEISAFILRKLADDAAEQANEVVQNVVITVPAYFNDVERAATVNAGQLAGLNVLDVLNEPTAAAIYYSRLEEEKGGTLKGNVLVYDLGGGTFDITVISMSDDAINVVVTDGNHNLGGKDWDDALIMYVAGEFQSQNGIDPMEDMQALQEMRLNCENAKRSLSNREAAKVAVSCQGQRGIIDVTLEKFNELTANLLAQTIELTQKCIADAAERGVTVDEILLVGGSSRMKQVEAAVNQATGKEARLFEPDMAVAKGAAVKAAWDAVSGGRTVVTSEGETVDTSVVDVDVAGVSEDTNIRHVQNVLSHSFGTILQDDDPKYAAWGNEKVEFMLPKQSPLPTSYRQTFYTVGTTDRVRIRVVQGEDENPAECTLLVEKPFEFGRVVPAQSPIELEFRANESGMLEVESFEPSTGIRDIIQVERVGVMTDEEVAAARDEISSVDIRQ